MNLPRSAPCRVVSFASYAIISRANCGNSGIDPAAERRAVAKLEIWSSNVRSTPIRLRGLALLLITPAIALAGPIIYEQPSVTPAVTPSTSQCFPAGSLFGFNVFDDFAADGGRPVADVHWRGHYFNSLAEATAVPAANSSGVGIYFSLTVLENRVRNWLPTVSRPAEPMRARWGLKRSADESTIYR